MAIWPIRSCERISVVKSSIKSACLGLATLICITGCSQALQLQLFNNTSGSIEVHLSRKTITIDSGASARFKYPATNEGWTLVLSASGCEVKYLAPHYPKYPFGSHPYDVPLKAQIEPDLAIHLVPPETKVVYDNVNAFVSLQTEGFPLQPSLRACPH